MREFRSSLPFILDNSGLEIQPHTIEIGDYILSPDVCVERKSIQDLISSFSDGRLYYQAEAMCKHFLHPILLLEFDPSKAFSLQTYVDFRAEPSANDLSSKLVLLCLHFPKLRIIWSCSPYATADIFMDLKKDADNPSIQLLESMQQLEADEEFDSSAKEILMRIPGVTVENHCKIMNKFRNLKELFSCELDELSNLIGIINAKRIHSFCNKSHGS